MMVIFVSECEKKSLKNTCRVLDAFANRIGSRTWETVITDEGLKSVKKLLRKTASKNTAVSCHWIRSRSRSELVWIVGNRNKFNDKGVVPVNTTKKGIINTQWENDWYYLPLIKSLAALAALFHDIGKASDFFQAKLKENKIVGDPIRHEWISILFLNAIVDGATDRQWLSNLADGADFSSSIQDRVIRKHKELREKNKPFKNLPNSAALLAWLILSHHRLPQKKDASIFIGKPIEGKDFKILLDVITQEWGYENKFDDYTENLSKCFSYSTNFPWKIPKWLKYAKKHAKILLNNLDLFERAIEDGSWRLVLHHARLVLMLGDHYHSSQNADPKWQDELNLYANTDRVTKKLKQKLGEHLLGVAKQAVRNAHLLPAFEGRHSELQMVYDVKVLKHKSPSTFRWQDKAVNQIDIWRKGGANKKDKFHFGFFAVNMASTGKGKTFANAKIMRALSVDGESLRYILALGLRTLTLQTGDEYRDRIGLGNDELAVLIGSSAVLSLHNKNTKEHEEELSVFTGSESEQSLLENELVFETEIPESNLSTVITDTKSRKFLYAPVLSCTIDHLMAATETKRGGRYILPTLRLMSSDLVIDEIDDFDGEDLIAIGRLIHLAAMLGRKVMISSATIPPDLAEGYFNAYQAGWRIFAKMRKHSPLIGCAWIDEFNTKIFDINSFEDNRSEYYQKYHQRFIDKRLEKLQQQIPKRSANIFPCDIKENVSEVNIEKYFYSLILEAVIEKHMANYVVDEKTGKRVSFGVVRVANIKPCVGLTKYLLDVVLPDGVEIRAMAYHSQQLLIMRSEQEKYLDSVLKRQGGDKSLFNKPEIRKNLDSIDSKNVIFILVATPVEEVGRDHDFDWAVVEPSSYRSFIQLAGRIRRHRDPKNDTDTPNIALLQYNLRGLKKQNRVFCRPGYESKDNSLDSHDLNKLLDVKAISKRLDAAPRISKSKWLSPRTKLADLEHEAIRKLLTNYDKKGPESMEGWVTGSWWLTAIPQIFVKFRRSQPQLTVYLVRQDEEWKFVEKDKDGEIVIIEDTYGIRRDIPLTKKQLQRLWLYRDYEKLLQSMGGSNLSKLALIYGEIGLPTYGKDLNSLSYIYSDQLGLVAT